MKRTSVHRFTLPMGLALAGFCLQASADLIHRYSFTTSANDSVGSAHGRALQVRNAGGPLGEPVKFEDGKAVLDGTGGYIDLPNGIISGLTNTTFEAWVVWNGGGAWQRVFDIGTANVGEDTDGSKAPGQGLRYLFLTPRSGPGPLRFAITDNSGAEERPVLNHSEGMAEGVPVHVAVTYGPGGTRLYVDGQPVASAATTIPLSAIEDNNVWLGRSNWPDPLFAGSFDEFRVHNSALGAAAVAASFKAGPSNPSYDPGALNSLGLTLAPQMPLGGLEDAEITAIYAGVGEIKLGGAEVVLTSSAPNTVEILPNGGLRGRAVGTATITATLDGKSATANIAVLPAPISLQHRYGFNEPAGSTEIKDSVGKAHAFAYPAREGTNAVVLGSGQAVFPGGAGYVNGAYVDLPDFIISQKTNVTFEVWATWSGPATAVWQRIFDIGSSGKGEDPHSPGNGTSSFYLTPRSGSGTVRFNAAPVGFAGEQNLSSSSAMTIGRETHIVGIYAPGSRIAQLWIDGRLSASGTTPFPLSGLRDENVWLGVSQWNDAPFNGSINEFRIYEGAMTEIDIALSRLAGPNALATAPGVLQSIQLSAASLLIGNRTATQATVTADYQNVKGVDVTGLTSATFKSSDTSVFSVSARGAMTPIAPGTASLIATYGGLSVTNTVRVLTPASLKFDLPAQFNAGGPLAGLVVTGSFEGTNANIVGFSGVTYSIANTNIAMVTTAGTILPLRPGSTEIISSYQGLTATGTVVVGLAPNHTPARLVHRYSFNEAPGTTVVRDSAGTANGTLVNPSAASDFTGNGRLKLQGGAWNGSPESGYVNLPNRLISGMTSTTIEGWIRWAGPDSSSWQRIFDFGRNSAINDNGQPAEDAYVNPGLSYMFLTPRSGDNTLRFAIKQGDGAELPQLNTTRITPNRDVHFAVVYDTASSAARLYVDGRRVQTGVITHPLSVLEDLNVYLGRSQWTDPYFAGEFDEFRIYNGSLLDDEIATSFAAGANTLPDLTPLPALTATLAGGSIELSWPAAGGFRLQVRTDLGESGRWQEVTASPATAGGTTKVTLVAGPGQAFYRLIK